MLKQKTLSGSCTPGKIPKFGAQNPGNGPVADISMKRSKKKDVTMFHFMSHKKSSNIFFSSSVCESRGNWVKSLGT